MKFICPKESDILQKSSHSVYNALIPAFLFVHGRGPCAMTWSLDESFDGQKLKKKK